MRRLRLLGINTFLSGYASPLDLPRKVMTRHRNERFRDLLARCYPLRSALIGLGEGQGEPAPNNAIPHLIPNALTLGKTAPQGEPAFKNRARPGGRLSLAPIEQRATL